jgi:hypothetical protein
VSRLSELDRKLMKDFELLRAGGASAQALTGLYIDEQQVAAALNSRPELSGLAIDEARLLHLEEIFGLSEFEVDVLLACVAVALNPVYERVFAFLQDDLGKKRPTPSLLMRIYGMGSESAVERRAVFQPTAPLFRNSLVSRVEVSDSSETLLNSALSVDERVVGHLLGLDEIDQRLLAHTEYEPEPQCGGIAADVMGRVVAAANSNTLLVLAGPPSIGKKDAARLFAACAGRSLLVVDVATLLRCQACSPPQAVRLIFREALLLGAAIYWSGANLLWSDDEKATACQRILEKHLKVAPFPCVLSGPTRWQLPAVIGERPAMRLSVSLPTVEERRELWQRTLAANESCRNVSAAAVNMVATTFRLSAEQIRHAVEVARGCACLEPDHQLRTRHLLAGARAVSSRQLANLAEEIVPRVTWDQLVLPTDAVGQLRELCDAVRERSKVLDEWGFGRRLSGGRGITALFAGVSGTGKTIGAEVVAGELGLALFKIDLASVVSKWLGETEKNMDRIFAAATDSNSILFFDEADALFGKRSEVKDSHDRYANLEISYLLQKMEAYEGIAILATNMRNQIDDAFLRRITFQVTFPFPEESDRARIWSAVWPVELPRHSDVELHRMARIKLSGGNIKNVVMAAAHLAASANRPVRTIDLVHAVRREYQKVGKNIGDTELEGILS